LKSKKLILLAVAIWLTDTAPAYPSPAVCRSIVTSWLGLTEPPADDSIDRSLDELFEHLDRGSLEFNENGQLTIRSGVHTYQGLMRVLQSHGLTAEDLADRAPSLRPLEGKDLRVEALHNGILRVQMGEDLWAKGLAAKSARVTVTPAATYFGIKTLFPKGMTAQAIRQLMKEFYEMVAIKAPHAAMTSNHYAIEECFNSSNPEIPPLRLKMVLSFGRPVSFFPTWVQSSCY
jgi:hypothetical protein